MLFGRGTTRRQTDESLGNISIKLRMLGIERLIEIGVKQRSLWGWNGLFQSRAWGHAHPRDFDHYDACEV